MAGGGSVATAPKASVATALETAVFVFIFDRPRGGVPAFAVVSAEEERAGVTGGGAFRLARKGRTDDDVYGKTGPAAG